MNSRECTRRAVEMKKPEWVPVYLTDSKESDTMHWCIGAANNFAPQTSGQSEWGFVWERLDQTLGQPKSFPLASWDDLQYYIPPNPKAEGRFNGLKEFTTEHEDKYLIGGMGITGFNLITFIRGFENVMEDLYFEKEKLGRLADIVFDFEENIIETYGKLGMDAVSFYDDWGTQSSLMISPSLWREFFKPRYKKQFAKAKQNGLHVFFHSCGYCYEIIEDLIEIGVDILNLNQPNIYEIKRLSEEFGGRVCFLCPIDIQTTAVKGGRDEIFAEAKILIDSFGKFDGGFIGIVQNYHSLGFMSQINYEYCIEAFKYHGKSMQSKGR